MFPTTLMPAATALTWVFCFILKLWMPDDDKKIIPTLACVTGILIVLVEQGASVESVLSGALSGLAATGADQVFRQYKKDTKYRGENDE